MPSAFQTLASTQETVADEALWSGLRALQEKEFILRRLAEEQSQEAPASAETVLREAEELSAFIDQMRGVVSSAPPGTPLEDSEELPERPAIDT